MLRGGPSLSRLRATQFPPRLIALAFLFQLGTVPGRALASDVDLVDFLINRDLVVEGVLQSVQKGTRTPVGGCGSTQESRLQVTEYRLKLTNVILGTAEDSLLVIADLGGPPSQAVPGARILGYANRLCVDSWRLWGGAIVIDGERMRMSQGDWSATKFDGKYSELLSSLQERVKLGNASAFHDAAGVAKVRLKDFWGNREARTYYYSCENLGWVVRANARVPEAIVFELAPECFPNLAVGDTLLLPVAEGSDADTLALKSCPGSLAVHEGFLGGFGVALGEVDRVLTAGAEGVRVARVVPPRISRH